MTKAEKNQQIKQITQELLERLNNTNGDSSPAADGGSLMEQQSRHESDSSSIADEKEIHNKLTQILNLIGDENSRDEAGADIVRSEEEFSRKMAEEVYDEIPGDGSEDLDLYQIQTEEIEVSDEQDLEAEIKKIAVQFFPTEDEEEKTDEPTEEERQQMARAQ